MTRRHPLLQHRCAVRPRPQQTLKANSRVSFLIRPSPPTLGMYTLKRNVTHRWRIRRFIDGQPAIRKTEVTKIGLFGVVWVVEALPADVSMSSRITKHTRILSRQNDCGDPGWTEGRMDALSHEL